METVEISEVLISEDRLESTDQAKRALMKWGSEAINHLNVEDPNQRVRACIGRVRGRGPGASIGRIFTHMMNSDPQPLVSPFEGSESVSGAAWVGDTPSAERVAWARLRFAPGTDGLMLHVHEHADRFIMVDEGRGLFHFSSSSLAEFTGDVRSTPIRERDVLLFRRGLLHTFSAPSEPLILWSFQAPFIPFDDPSQFTPVSPSWYPRDLANTSTVACDPAWTVLCAGSDTVATR